MKYILQKIRTFWKKETVLSITIILALLSMFIVRPNAGYLDYIDVRTLVILFSMMAVVAGLKKLGVFDWLAQKLLHTVQKSHTIKKAGGSAEVAAVSTILVGLCFFGSMLITNDASLITFVPFTIAILKQMENVVDEKTMIRVVVMQTIAANLGSMLTPIGNPQNLYLYGLANMEAGQFVWMMLPLSLASLVMLFLWIWVPVLIGKRKAANPGCAAMPDQIPVNNSKMQEKVWKLIAYLLLLVCGLLSVGHLLPIWILLALVLAFTLLFDRKVLLKIDYSLLGTFVALFIFVGNLGHQEAFSSFLHSILNEHEVMVSVLASQVMSNVPAAILLSGFTNQIEALIIGTNLGGLGTLIASMASLISFKYIARENPKLRGRFFIEFTIANLLFLAALLAIYYLL